MSAHLRSMPGKLRIIAGHLRGSRIIVPDKIELRPTAERVRETLFNWLAPVIEHARCLDLFAGTGALGLEALSRSAEKAVFVERDRILAQLLTDNLVRLKVENGQVYCSEALAFLRNIPTAFDIVFLDPPFNADMWGQIAALLESGGWLAPRAWIYVEAPAEATPLMPACWTTYRKGKAGAVQYILYRRNAA